MPLRVAVVGGSNVDISATATEPLRLGDSNLGRVNVSVGGVGRNVAENLSRLGVKVRLITAYGDDAFASLLKDKAKEAGMDTSQSAECAGFSSSVYGCVNQPNGEMFIAVSDMDVCGELTPAFMQSRLDGIQACDALVLDANIPAETLLFLAKTVSIPVFADSVSAQKVCRLRQAIPYLEGIKTNRREAELLTGLSLGREEDSLKAAKDLHRLGVKKVLITLAEDGGFFSDGKSAAFMPSLVHGMLNTTGCGDACLAGIVYAFLNRRDYRAILKTGMAMAGICAAAETAVSPALTPALLKNYMKRY